MTYDRYDAAYDAAMDAWHETVQPHLDRLVDPIMNEVEVTDEAQPHPWTYERHLLQIWLDEGEDALREMLEEEHRDEAEDAARDYAYDNTPCCNDFHCPCGNSNNYRG